MSSGRRTLHVTHRIISLLLVSILKGACGGFMAMYWVSFHPRVVSRPQCHLSSVQFSSVQSLSRVWLFATAWIAARQASLSITNSRSSHRLTSIKSVMPSSHLILCRPLLLLPPIPPSIRVFSNESTLRKRWPKYWSFSFSNTYKGSGIQPWNHLWQDVMVLHILRDF